MKYSYLSKLLLALTILCSQIVTAQTTKQQSRDSTKQRASMGVKEKFPSTRILNFEYGQSLSRDFNSTLYEENLNEGKIKNQFNFKASANIPVYSKGTFSVTASGRYQYNRFDFTNLENTPTTQIFEKEGTEEFHYLTTAVSATYFSMLFKKPVIYTASIFMDGNENGFERVKGLLGLSFILKQNTRTTMTLGGIAFLDLTSQLPIFPTFSYAHKFKNSKWELDFIMPQRLLFRRFVGENGRLSLGSTFGVTGFYANIDSPGLPKVNEYSQLEIKSGVIYEHRFTNFLIGTFQGGIQNFISNRLTEKSKPTKDHLYKNTQDPTGYFQIGISIDPFARKN